jgi:hypothetical protein
MIVGSSSGFRGAEKVRDVDHNDTPETRQIRTLIVFVVKKTPQNLFDIVQRL